MRLPLTLAAILLATTVAAQATPYVGVGLSGLETNSSKVPGKASTDYAVPNPAYYLGLGVKLVRNPYLSQRMETGPGTAFNVAYLGYLQANVKAENAAGAIAVVEPHNYGTINIDGTNRDITTDGKANFIDHITRLAAAFANQPLVAVELMNEPHEHPDASYIPVWNEAIAAIRKAGFKGVVIVPAAEWSSPVPISVNSSFPIVDPLNNWVLEIHCYPDPDGSGTWKQPIASATVGSDRMKGAIAWSKKTGIKLFLGEFATPADAVSISALRSMYVSVETNRDQFWGTAQWGAGPWWSPTYPARMDPINGVEQPQTTEMRAALAALAGPVVDTVTITASADACGSDPANAQVMVDNKQLGGTVVTAQHAKGETQAITYTGTWPRTAAHEVGVKLTNYATATGCGRNLYVSSINLDGTTIVGKEISKTDWLKIPVPAN